MSQTALVVEDDLSLAGAINKKLQLSGFTTLNARSVDEALRLMDEHQPIGVIWLDHYLLGGKDGLAFTAVVRARDDWKAIPIYIVSNTASNDKVASYNKLGISRYYVKADHRLDEIIADIKTNMAPA
ncbi:MAG TPA: response regulator [Candidatus Saccharimonadales bacterium]|nr:response regulator [Candidatus Saccharimonadales bacterium]